MNSANNKVIFLGASDRQDTNPIHPYFQTPISLKNLGFYKQPNLYPADISGLTFHFLVNKSLRNFILEFEIRGRPKAIIKAELTSQEEQKKESETEFCINPNWSHISFSIKDVTMPEPGVIDIYLIDNGKREKFSELYFAFEELEKLSKEELLAIESNLYMAQKVRAILGCKHCKSSMKVYYGTKRDFKLENKGYRFIDDAPDVFICGCGETETPLKYIKSNLAQTLRTAGIEGRNYNYESIYTESALNQLTKDFLKIIHSNPKEEEVQKFIEENTILLSHFNPKKIKFKTKISDKFVTDFAILDTSNNLLLIEIEKPSTRLFKNAGHATSDFNHAYEQVNDWLYELEESRKPLLDNFGLKSHEVNEIKGFVIAGLAQTEKEEYLRRHKIQKNSFERIKFIAFDELLSSTINSIRTFLDKERHRPKVED